MSVYRITLACDLDCESDEEARERAAKLRVLNEYGDALGAETVNIEDENWREL